MPKFSYKLNIGILLFVLMLMPMLSAELQYWQTLEDIGNQSTKNHLYFCNYDNTGLDNISNFVSGNNFFETYLIYNIYPQSFNSANPSSAIDNCNLIIRQSTLSNGTYILLNKTYNSSTFDVMNGKYFLRMKPQDCASADIICKYSSYVNLTHPSLTIPAEIQLVTPTWECKACQYYEWSVTYRAVEKAQDLNAKRVAIVEYIKQLFLLNYEMWLAIFWIFLILMIFVGIGMIFIIVYWLYLYLRSVAK